MTEAHSSDVGAAGAALEVKTAMTGFFDDFKAFQGRIERKLKVQDDRIAMLDRKSVARPALAQAAELGSPHEKAVAAYVRHGDEQALREIGVEAKGLSTAVAAEGGYLVDEQTASRIAGVLRGASSLRSVARVVAVNAGSYDVIVDHADLEAGWSTESALSVETEAVRIDRISIPLHELAAMPKASQRLLDDAAFDIEGWLAERIADKFARAENAAFVAGDGVDKPKGFLSYPQVANDAWAWGSLGYVRTGVDGNFNAGDPADTFVDLVYALGARYRVGGAFVMNSKTAGAVRKLKDVDGRFLWIESIAADQPARLLGYPVVICEDMPDIAAGAASVAFGDFGAGYTIAERPTLRILRDPFSAKPHVQFYASSRVGGDVTDFAAIKLMKFAAS